MKTYVQLFLIFNCCMVCSQTSVTFSVQNVQNTKYKNIGIRGDKAPLSWEKSIPLEKNGDEYTTTILFDRGIDNLQFKYVCYNSDRKPEWESIGNRTLQLSKVFEKKVNHSWNTEESIDLSTLEEISSKKLLQDFELIKTMVLEVHPGTYRYNNQNQINVTLTKLEETFQNDLTHGEAYVAISKLLATLQCDHTFASFYNQGPTLKAVIHNQRDKLPFTFSWVGEKMIVLNDVSGQLAPGTEIKEINGVQVETILKKLMLYTKADGATDKSRLKQLEIDGHPFRYNAFDVFHPLIFDVDNDFELSAIFPNGDAKAISVTATTRLDRAQKLKEKYPNFAFEKSRLWSYEKLEERIGYLKAGTFDDYGMDRNWRSYFNETFKRIEKDGIEHLIVDLRKNQGGFDEIGLGLMQHLIQKGGAVGDFTSKSRYKNFPESLKPYAKSWGEPWFHTLEVASEKDENGYYSLPEEKAVAVRPAKNAFKGEVYFLIGPANVSMAFYVVNAIKKYNIGTLIGEETGGNQRGINGGQILFLRLPNSEIEIDFPVEGSFSKESDLPNRGIIPDVEVATSLDDIKSGKDAQLEAALQLIKSNGTE